jgi:hypothetical protein
MAALHEDIDCSCYGCVIGRVRAGVPLPDRSAEPCKPVGACQKNGQCWTHSEWIDEAACDPPNACVNRILCSTHDKEPR